MLYIVRHGQTDWNKEKRLMGRIDIPLNDEGRKESYELKKRLKNVSFDYVFVSPLKRAMETADILTDKEKIIDERLIERGNGQLEGKLKKDGYFDIDFNAIVEAKYGLEPVIEVQKRVESFFNEIKEKYSGKNILVVTHGGVIISIRYLKEGNPTTGNYNQYIIGNCEVITYDN